MAKLRVAIIGGGPGGTACALALQRLAREKSTTVEITLFEGKEFNLKQQHNQCVGVLSPPLPSLLEDHLEVPFPRNICVGSIDSYILHSAGEEIELKDHGEPSTAVQRIQFDAYMLEQVVARGITVYPARAVDLEFHSDSVIVYAENQSMVVDVVVGAFGMDEGSAAMFSRSTIYHKPQALDSVILDLPIQEADLNSVGNRIHVFLPGNPRIEFGAVTPKCDHLTINIAGKRVDSHLLRSFLTDTETKNILQDGAIPQNWDPNLLQVQKGRFPRSSARGFYGNRYVMVGDASGLVRAFKGKGATTAMQTGIRAAETIIHHGVTAQVFSDFYRTANRDIIQDLPYGRGMRQATLMMSRIGGMGMVLRAAHKSPALKSALFGAVSGHMPFREILIKILHPKVVLAILGSVSKKSG